MHTYMTDLKSKRHTNGKRRHFSLRLLLIFFFSRAINKNSCLKMGEWIDEKQNTHSWQIVSSAIRWHQTMRHEKMGGAEGEGTKVHKWEEL